MTRAHTKIALARFGIQMYDSDNGIEAIRLVLKSSDEVETVAVNNDYLYYNAAWVMNTHEREIEQLVRETVASYRVLNG